VSRYITDRVNFVLEKTEKWAIMKKWLPKGQWAFHQLRGHGSLCRQEIVCSKYLELSCDVIFLLCHVLLVSKLVKIS
jgi:hypothetical protein